MARRGLFISYSHADRQWLRELHIQLVPLVRLGLALWDDTQLGPGAQWRREIQRAIAQSRAALLLVSPDFLASEFIDRWELAPLLEARDKEALAIMWVHVRACLYEQTAIGSLQAAHDVTRPLDSLAPPERGAMLAEICRRVQEAMGIGRGEPGTHGALASAAASGTAFIRYALVLSGTIVENDRPVADALLGQLRAIARDSRLTVVRIDAGSIHLTLQGTVAGFLHLQEAFVGGALERDLGREVHALCPVDEVDEPRRADRDAPATPIRPPGPSGGAGASSVNRLGSILPPGNVRIDVDATSKKRVFEHAGMLFEDQHAIARSTVTDNLFARERLGSTGLGHGVAIPHGRIKGLKNPLAAVLRVRQPIPFDAPDDEPVVLLIFLLVPEAATQRHLEILSEIAEMLSDRQLREQLKTEGDPAVLHQMIFQWKPLEWVA